MTVGKRGIGEVEYGTGPSGIDRGSLILLPFWTGPYKGGVCLGVGVEIDDAGCLMVSGLRSLSGKSWFSGMIVSGAFMGVELMWRYPLRDLVGRACSSPVAGVGAIEEFWPDSGSAIVDAEPCGAVRSTTRFCGAGVTRGESGLDTADLCR